MPSYQRFTMSYNGKNGWIPLYPNMDSSTIVGWDLGILYGPYQITLPASGWSNKSQTVSLNGVTPFDKFYCTKVLSGTSDQMKAQDSAYNLLETYLGIESELNQIKFICTSSVPTIDLTVQVYCFR